MKKQQEAKSKLRAEKSFWSDPHKFAATLFANQRNTGQPQFSAEEAQQYFVETYRDISRDHVYQPLPDFERPEFPSHIFSLRCPTAKELEKSVKRKRNGAAPGLNALTYVPYKKCNALMKFVQ